MAAVCDESSLAKSSLGEEMGAGLLAKIIIPNSGGRFPYGTTEEELPNNSFAVFRRNMEGLSLNDQVKALSRDQLSDVQLLERWQFSVDIFFVLRQLFPACEVHVFGSLITGLSDPCSDIDIYVDTKGDNGRSILRKEYIERREAIDNIQDTVYSFLKTAKCPHTAAQFACDLERIGCRVPIVRFRHGVCKISCDLSFGSVLSVKNSKLIRFYIDYDPRLKPLLVFLRIWADRYDLAGSQRIKKYALSLLAIVFFAENRVVPTVDQLQLLSAFERHSNPNKSNDHVIDGWDSSFCTDLEMIDTIFGQEELPPDYMENPGKYFMQTVSGFFEMIKSTNFDSHLASPLLGKMIPKDDLIFVEGVEKHDNSWLTKWRRGYSSQRSFCKETKILNPLVIQDPFDYDFNVARLVDKSLRQEFREVCEQTLNLITTNSEITSILDLFSH